MNRKRPGISPHLPSMRFRRNARKSLRGKKSFTAMGGEREMERTIRTRRRELLFFGEAQTPLPGRQSLTRRRLPYRSSNRGRRPAANARSSPESGPNNSINFDKLPGFFNKLPEIFGTFYLNIFNRLRISDAHFRGNSGKKVFLGYVKFKQGISPPGASRSRSAGCRSCPRPPAGGWNRGNSARRAAP